MTASGKSLRTPLGLVRAEGAGRSGTDEAWLMTATSVAFVPLTIGFVILVLNLLHKDYNQVRETIGRPLPAIVLLLFIGVGIRHMEVGMRSVILDYIKGPLREWALLANLLFASAVVVACLYAALRIGFV